MDERVCVFTVLTDGYEPLREQPMAARSDVDFIAFVDTDLESDTWETRRFDKLFPADHRRSQNVVRLRPDLFLPEYDRSIYIDNTVSFVRLPEELLALVPSDAGVAACPAPVRSVERAFRNVARLGVAPESVLREQWEHYNKHHAAALGRHHFTGAMMIRHHHRPEVVTAMRIWLWHVLRYSGRNQIAQQIAFAQAGIDYFALPFSLDRSGFVRRDRSTRIAATERPDVTPGWTFDGPDEISRVLEAAARSDDRIAARAAEIAHLETLLARAAARRAVLDRELARARERLDGLEVATSWRMTAPTRWLADRVRRR